MEPVVLEVVYFAGLIVAVGIRAPHELRRMRTHVTDHRVDRLEVSLMGLVVVGMFLAPVIHSLTPWLGFADYRLPPWAGISGVAVFAVALWLFGKSHADLGRNFSPTLEVREEHTLVTHGVYRSVRHPMYAAQWLWGVSQALLLQNWVAGLSGLALSVLLYLLRIPREERMMLERFGEEYRAYMRRTGRILPCFENTSHPRPRRTELR
jgi:protein-S-isoprenylcysteine O-methyltransferase Ste14